LSAIDQVNTSLQSAIEELDNAANAAGAAQSSAEEGLGHAVAAGGGATVAGYNVLKEAIEKLTQQIAAANKEADEAIGHARAIADGT
jgi:hypothetical protein